MNFEMDEIIKKYNKLSEPFHKKKLLMQQQERQYLQKVKLKKLSQIFQQKNLKKLKDELKTEVIPDYWLTVFKNCEQLSQDLFETDYPILKHLQSIEHIEIEGTSNYSIKFFFSANEFFENDSLTVKFIMLSDDEVDKIEGTDIKWKEGKDITKKQVTKKQKNKKTGKTRTVTKTVDAESFFNFFKTTTAAGAKTGGEDDEDDEQLERLDINLDISKTIVEELIPSHLEYYLGVIKDDGCGHDHDGSECSDDEDLDDEKPKKKKGGDDSDSSSGGEGKKKKHK